MGRHVVVVASGETERRSLPHLVSHLRDQGVFVDEVRIPPGNGTLNVSMAERLIKAAWYASLGSSPPDKFVILVDLDNRAPDDALGALQDELPQRLGDEVGAKIKYAYAQQHLEAWYFGDTANLRAYLGHAPGHIDTSRPDEIENPKNHLKNVLDNRVYTARISEEIAMSLDPKTIAGRSPSFRGFLEAVKNGVSSREADGP